MRSLGYRLHQTRASNAPFAHPGRVPTYGVFNSAQTPTWRLVLTDASCAKRVWWEGGHVSIHDLNILRWSQAASPSSEALKSTRLALNLARVGRQAAAGLVLTLVDYESEISCPVTLFTGSWIAHLLGYPRKYRGAKLVEAFMGSAIRSYLVLYHFLPFCLRVRGAFFNFNFFWKIINNPSGQVFLHPIAAEIVWDIRLPVSVDSSFAEVKEALAHSIAEFGRGVPSLEDGILDYEARTFAVKAAGLDRYKFSWDQVLFLPTRINRPRKPKKARSIRKRLSKRLVRATGRRFWAS